MNKDKAAFNFELENTILDKIINKEDLTKRELGYVERGLKILSAYSHMLNECLEFETNGIFQIRYLARDARKEDRENKEK